MNSDKDCSSSIKSPILALSSSIVSSHGAYQTLKKVYFPHNSIVCLFMILLFNRLYTKPEKINLQ